MSGAISLIVVLLNVLSVPAVEIHAEIPASECPDGKEYQECGSACPLTCGQPDLDLCSLVCVSGCFCPSGQYLSGDKCVCKEECPSISTPSVTPTTNTTPSVTPTPGGCDCNCSGKCYKTGNRFRSADGCNTCFCSNGNVDCTKKACRPSGTSNASCAYDGKCYKHRDNFNSTDGCNTCNCYNGSVSCTEAFCYPLSCPENMQFRNCSYHVTCQQREASGSCVPGCFCRRGFFEYKGSCVKRRICSAAKCNPKRTKEVIKTEDGCESERRVNIRRCSGFCADSQTACQTEKTVRKSARARCSGGRRTRIAYDTAVKCCCSACDP
eukprot:m.129828 g.129828  ORF g.129828 m.129828 type:complete len:324 (+) comp37990_c0_seq12:119-1090(+)